jgi:hypothetical protein
MIVALVASIALSAAMGWACGAAFIARPGTPLRSKGMMVALVIATLSFVPAPPQVLLLGASPMKVPGDTMGVTAMLAFPKGFVAWPWWALWVLATIGAVLAGGRIWDAGKAGWRSAPGAYDTSAAGRARALLLMADSIADVADTVARLGLTPKDADKLAPDLRTVGRRLAPQLPSDASGLYRQLSTRGVPPTVAGPVARSLAEGARDSVAAGSLSQEA